VGTKPKALRRTLFGVRAGDVQDLLADRELTALAAADQVRAAEERALSVEARASELEAQLAEAARAREELERTRPTEASRGTDTVQLLRTVREEMTRVLHATQEAGSRILERTRAGVEHDLEDADRRREQTEAERQQLQAWTADARATIGQLWQRLNEAGNLLQTTRKSVDQAVGSLDTMMAQLETELHSVRAVLDRFQTRSADQEHAPPHPQTEDRASAPVALPAPSPPIDVDSTPPAGTAPHATENGHAQDGSQIPSPQRMEEDQEGHRHQDRVVPQQWAAGPTGTH
jgi:hypothetical protein